MRLSVPIALALVALTAAVYEPVRSFDFVDYDDGIYVYLNENLLSGPSVESALGAFGRFESNWIPLTRLSLQLDHALHGREAGGYHVTNAVLHALATLVLWLALSRMTGAPGRSAFVAAVFAVHPLHVESVAWVTERKDVLSGLLWMLALWAYAGYAERPSAGRMALVTGLLVLGLGAKPMLVTFPFALLLLDLWPLGRLGTGEGGWPQPARLRAAVVEKWPLFLATAVFSVVAFDAQQVGGSMDFGDRIPLGARVSNALESLVLYLAMSVRPVELAVFYPHPEGSGPLWRPVAASALLVAITAGAVAARRRCPALLVGWLWYVGTLVPVLGLVQVGQQARADRYMYLPLIGLSIALAWGATALLGRSRPARTALAVTALGAVLALALVARAQVWHWRDSLSLFTRAREVTEGNFIAERGLAKVRVADEDWERAERHYQEALKMRPGWTPARLGLADVAAGRGEVRRALRILEGEHARDPEDPQVAGKLGLIRLRTGRAREAAPLIALALEQQSAPELHVGMALSLAAAGDCGRAAAHGRRARRMDPGFLPATNNLAWLLATCPDASVRNGDEAIALARAAIELAGERPGLLDTLAAAYAAAGRYDEATATAERASRLANAAGATGLATQIRERASLYASGQPYVETP